MNRRVALKGLVSTLASLAALGTATVAAAGPASAHVENHHRPHGTITSARLNTWNNRLTVRGWAFDPDHARRSVVVRVRTGHHGVAKARANHPSRTLDRSHHIRGQHRFVVHVKVARGVRRVRILSGGIGGTRVRLDRHHVNHVRPAAGRRIIDVAQRYVHKVPYRYGGSSPRQGFDCSGYTMWVYAHAHVRKLPHSAQAQREVNALHRIPRRHARPGDLIFYLSGGSAYHVAIYGGHGTDYAATQPGQKIQHQPLWGHDLVFKTLR